LALFRKLSIDGVNRAVTTLEGIAGKSINVAKVLKVLGEEPLATGFLGGQRGENFRQSLRERGIEHEFISVPAQTRQCVTVIDEEAETQTELVEESQAIDPQHYERLLEIVRRRTSECRAVILSGTLTPGASVDFYLKCARHANKAGVLSILDIKGEPLEQTLSAKPGLVKPNREELAATVNRKLNDEASLVSAVRSLRERGAERVVITAGAEPAIAFDGQTLWRIIAPPISVINPIGSGDAFTAALTSRLLRGDDLGEACRWGSAAGAANALTLMAGELDRKEIDRLAPLVKVEKLRN